MGLYEKKLECFEFIVQGKKNFSHQKASDFCYILSGIGQSFDSHCLSVNGHMKSKRCKTPAEI